MTSPLRDLPLADVPLDERASCCVRAYESDWARLLLGDSLHPGGRRLTQRLATLLRLGPDSRVLDVAAGRGESALHLAATFGCRIVGVDAGALNIAEARRRAHDSGLDHLVSFELGDATRIDVADAAFDAVICECAFCTFADKRQAASEFARALRRGGAVGISDITCSGTLPAELQGLLAWIACIADALPSEGYASLLREAGLHVDVVEEHDDALHELIDAVRQRLLGAGLLAAIGGSGVDVEDARRLAVAAVDAVNQGALGYAIVCASKS